MRPEKLILKGIYSYKNETEIDFSTLCKADLFGIFGNVGSGKSAVLEAITYVLFGRIERLPASRLTYNMMNLRSDRMSIDFIFSQAGERYRFTFEAKRNKKNFDKIETPVRGGYRESGGEWIPLFDKDSDVTAEEIIGLNYDNFRRTVIVPQGRFQEFLHLEKTKRTEMLMELFQLDRFDLFASSSSLASENSRKTATVEGELSGLSDVDEPGLKAAEDELVEIEKKLQEYELKIRKSDAELAGWIDTKKFHTDYTKTKKELDLQREKAAKIEVRKKSLRRFEDCRELFRADLSGLEAAEADLKESEIRLRQTGNALEGEKNLFEKICRDFESIEASHRNIEQMKKEADWLRLMISLKDEAAAVSALRASLAGEQFSKSELDKQSSSCLLELEQVRAELGDLDTSLPPADLMRRFSDAFSALEEHKSAIISEEGNLNDAESAANEINRELTGLEIWMHLKTDGAQDFPPQSLEAAEELLAAAREGAAELERGIRQKQLAEGISSEVRRLAQSLVEGEACPVCGAHEHPSPASGEFEGDQGLKAEHKELEELTDLLERIASELNRLRRQQSVLVGRIEGCRERLMLRKTSLAQLLEEFPEGPFSPDDPKAFRAVWDQFVEADEKRQHLQQMLSALTSEAEKCRLSVQQKDESINDLNLKLASAEAGLMGKKERIDQSFYGKNNSRDAAGLTGELRMTESGIQRISSEYEKLEKLKQDTGLQYEKRKTEYSLNEVRLEELSERRLKLGDSLGRKIEEFGYIGIEEVAAVLALDLVPEQERAEIDKFTRETDRLKAELDRLEQELGGRVYDEKEHRDAETVNAALKQEQTQAAAASGKVRSLIADGRRRLVRKKELEIELDRLALRGENINTLRNLFKGKKFIDYAATVYLRQLCEAANDRFRKLTRESLRLELDESNNFIVRDYLNEGKIRSVKTLSGGQTFQAAFSLSLALADSIGKERSGFFFLDEGFGSLDRESLALVFDSLKSLKHEERTVGVISHVEELKQEIDTYITVNKETEEGSLIINSWNN